MSNNPLKYVIQEHHATHLHWDLRLELDGVAKSWALPKEPTSEEGVRRLAVLVNDHDVGYMEFEGEVTEDYGRGTVKIWDSGFWVPESIKEKKIVAIINGKKLNGRFTILNFKDKSWLFFKAKER